MNAAPVEANTLPAALPRKARKPRASAAHWGDPWRSGPTGTVICWCTRSVAPS